MRFDVQTLHGQSIQNAANTHIGQTCNISLDISVHFSCIHNVSIIHSPLFTHLQKGMTFLVSYRHQECVARFKLYRDPVWSYTG